MPKFKIKASKKIITARSGLSMLAMFCDKMGLEEQIKKLFPGTKSNRGYSPDKFINGILLMLNAGGSNLEDIRNIKQDLGLRQLLKNSTIPDPSTVGDWLRRVGSNTQAFNSLNRFVFAQSCNNISHKYLTLDIDATGIKANKYDALYTYKGYKGYMPILGHIAETGTIISHQFREGNVAPATKNLEFIKQCISNLPKNKEIKYLRADSASYQAEIFNYCESQDIKYVITGKMSEALRITLKERCFDWQAYIDRHGVKTGGEITTIVWSMEHTKKAFTLIVKRSKRSQYDIFEGMYHYHIVATNDLNRQAIEIMQWYSLRGETSENRIKELKYGFAANRMPCGQFIANRAFFDLCVLAYNIFVLFKYCILDKKWRTATVQKVRLYIYNLPGLIVRQARYIFLKIPDYFISEIYKVYRRLIYDDVYT